MLHAGDLLLVQKLGLTVDEVLEQEVIEQQEADAADARPVATDIRQYFLQTRYIALINQHRVLIESEQFLRAIQLIVHVLALDLYHHAVVRVIFFVFDTDPSGPFQAVLVDIVSLVHVHRGNVVEVEKGEDLGCD